MGVVMSLFYDVKQIDQVVPALRDFVFGAKSTIDLIFFAQVYTLVSDTKINGDTEGFPKLKLKQVDSSSYEHLKTVGH